MHLNIKQIIALLFGHLATSLWMFPMLPLILHSFRGVKFENKFSVFLGRGVILDNRYPGLITIGEDVWITARCIILTHSFYSSCQVNKLVKSENIAAVKISSGVFIGVGSIILPGVTINEGAYIAAGSVVTKDVECFCLYAGNPAKYVKSLLPKKNS